MKLVTQFSLLLAFILLLAGCSNEAAPPLVVEGEPTLVYVYTEG